MIMSLRLYTDQVESDERRKAKGQREVEEEEQQQHEEENEMYRAEKGERK